MEGYPQVPASPLSNEYYEPAEPSPEQKLRQNWEETYMDPQNKGRGGGIVGWIEERTGLSIDPETFFTEELSEEVLQSILANFRDDELNYLESQGILVAEEEIPLPSSYGYGGYGGYGKASYTYPSAYSQKPQRQRNSNPNLGLVSWSI
jgi:hypothetical protein